MVVAPGSTEVAPYGAAHGFMRSGGASLNGARKLGLNDGGEMADGLVIEER